MSNTNFPALIDSPTNPTATNLVTSPAHHTQHGFANDAIVALETKVGIDGSAVNTTIDYKLSGVTTGDKAVSKTGTETLTNKTLTSPTITNKTSTGTDAGAETLTHKTITDSTNTVTANSVRSATTVVNLDAATAPSNGQVLTATSSTTATWQTPGGLADYSCRVHNSSGNSVTTGLSALTWDTEDFDTDSMHSTSSNTSRITFTHAGKYMITGSIFFASTVNGVGVYILLNGTTYIAAGGGSSLSSTNPSSAACATTIYSASANDYVELVATINTGTLSTLTGSSFSAYHIA